MLIASVILMVLVAGALLRVRGLPGHCSILYLAAARCGAWLAQLGLFLPRAAAGVETAIHGLPALFRFGYHSAMRDGVRLDWELQETLPVERVSQTIRHPCYHRRKP